MFNKSQNEYPASAQLVSFQQKVRSLTDKNRSFAATVRDVFTTIEPAIKDGTPLEAILSAINEHYGLNGSLSALKSALSRIRKETAAMRFLGIRLAPDGSLLLPTSANAGNVGVASQFLHASHQNSEAGAGQMQSGTIAQPPSMWQNPVLAPAPHASQIHRCLI